jgi:UDP-4-amino-4,6-dideoxy-N-acetyl-beta-L-altrosamine N-acetyltransferase
MGRQNIRNMTFSDLKMVLAWRNHPEVRRYMFTQDEIKLDDHKKWYESTLGNSNKHLLVYEIENTPQGFVSFSVTNDSKVADWGFYASPGAFKGIGTLLGKAALDYAFREIGLRKVCGQVLAFNQRSTGLHNKLGFEKEGVLREQHLVAGEYHSVFLFGLLASEWP